MMTDPETQAMKYANLVYSLKGRFETDHEGTEHNADTEAMDAADAIEDLTRQRDQALAALEFYARHEHWMALHETGGSRTVLAAMGAPPSECGWAVAEAALKDKPEDGA